MIYMHSGKWDVGASGLLGGTHIVLRPPCGSRTSRTPEWAPGTPHIASAAAVVAAGGGEPADRVSSLRRSRAGGRAGSGAPRGAAPIGVAVQAGPGDRPQAEGHGAVGAGGDSGDPAVGRHAQYLANKYPQFLPSEVGGKPFKEGQGKAVVHPHSLPPTNLGGEVLGFLPPVQRERAGFIERLGHYF